MNWLDLLFGVDLGTDELEQDRAEIEREAARLAEAVDEETVTRGRLANDEEYTRLPAVVYLEDDERPRFLLRGGALYISDDAGSVRREFPFRESLVLVTDRRVVFVVGNRRTDDLWAVEHDDLVETYLDDESWRRFLVVDANADGDPMTFYADVTLEGARSSLEEAVAYLSSRGSGE